MINPLNRFKGGAFVLPLLLKRDYSRQRGEEETLHLHTSGGWVTVACGSVIHAPGLPNLMVHRDASGQCGVLETATHTFHTVANICAVYPEQRPAHEWRHGLLVPHNGTLTMERFPEKKQVPPQLLEHFATTPRLGNAEACEVHADSFQLLPGVDGMDAVLIKAIHPKPTWGWDGTEEDAYA